MLSQVNLFISKKIKLFVYNQNLNLDIKIFSLLFSILPLALITGPAIPDIIISTIAFYFLIKVLMEKEISYLKNYFFFFFIAFCLYGVVRSLFTPFFFFSLFEEGALFYFRYIFFILGLNYLLNQNKDLLKIFINVCFFSIIILSFDSFFQFIYGKNIIGILPATENRITSFFGDEAILGRYLSYLSAFLLFYIFCFKLSFKLRILGLIITLISIASIILSGDRIPLLRILIILSLLVALVRVNKSTYLILFLITIFFSLFFVATNDHLKERLIFESLDIIKGKQILIGPFGRDYENIFLTSFEVGKTNPLFGRGPNSFEILCPSPDIPSYKSEGLNCSHSHNFFFQVFAEQGLIGLSFLILFFIYLFKTLFKNIILYYSNSSKINIGFEKVGSTLITLIFLLPMIPNMNFYNNWNNVFIFISITLFIHYNQKQSKILK